MDDCSLLPTIVEQEKFSHTRMDITGEKYGAKLLYRLRIDKGLTQKELAKASGVGQSTISRIEKNNWERINAETILQVAACLGADPNEIFKEGPDDPTLAVPVSSTRIIDEAMEKIEKLIEWKNTGNITEEEFSRMKAKVIKAAKI